MVSLHEASTENIFLDIIEESEFGSVSLDNRSMIVGTARPKPRRCPV